MDIKFNVDALNDESVPFLNQKIYSVEKISKYYLSDRVIADNDQFACFLKHGNRFTLIEDSKRIDDIIYYPTKHKKMYFFYSKVDLRLYTFRKTVGLLRVHHVRVKDNIRGRSIFAKVIVPINFQIEEVNIPNFIEEFSENTTIEQVIDRIERHIIVIIKDHIEKFKHQHKGSFETSDLFKYFRDNNVREQIKREIDKDEDIQYVNIKIEPIDIEETEREYNVRELEEQIEYKKKFLGGINNGDF